MSYETIVYEKRGPIAYVTLNRPDKLNALSEDLQLEVRHALENAGWEDEEVRVIVLKAAGRAFSAGFDITAGQKMNAVERRAQFLKGKTFSGSAWWDVFWNNPKPIIAQNRDFVSPAGSPPPPFVICGSARKTRNSARPRSAPAALTSRLCGRGWSA
jgi:enoyl-CoA hydratase/carnithine racemase